MPYYYVHIVYVSKVTRLLEELGLYDMSKENVQQLVAQPYMNGEEFFLGGRRIDPSLVDKIHIWETEESVRKLEQKAMYLDIDDVLNDIRRGNIGKLVTSNFIKSPPCVGEKKTPKKTSKNVFIVHGKDDKPKLELARMLEKLGFNTIILSEQPDKGRTIIEKLEQETFDIGYAFVILTPDDTAFPDELPKIPSTRPELKRRARQNVILELGYFVGKIGRNRVCCLYKGDVELPSDIHGVLFKKFNESIEECYKGILEELKAAGYEIKL